MRAPMERTEPDATIDSSQLDALYATARHLTLVVIGDGFVQSHPLPKRGALTIGRGETCDVVIEHPLISREHAKVRVEDGLSLEDLGSRNGTRLHGQRLPANAVRAFGLRQIFEVGETVCLVQESGLAPAARRLATHGYFEERLAEACARAQQSRRPFVVARVSVSDPSVFGGVHDLAREADVAASYASGELELLVADAERANDLLGRLHREFGERIRVGVARYGPDGRTPDALLDAANQGALDDRIEDDQRIVVDPAMKALYAVAERIAKGSIGVLLLGETGVGKEVFAEAVHEASPRRDRPFVRLNCAALNETLLESELFGHEKGAFTGAAEAKTGLIEAADGGTVLLDELGEMTLATQAKLLRVLEQKQVVRVGAVAPIDVDVRFIGATNRDLEAEVVRGTFRQDVYFRLDGASLTIPPLRERTREIEPLARRFAEQTARELGLDSAPTLTPAALDLLLGHAWPGNIRELKNVMARAVLLATGDVIDVEHLPHDKMSLPWTDTTASAPAGDDERARILDALDKCAGNQTRAAKMLGIGRRTLTTKLTKYGIRRPRKRS